MAQQLIFTSAVAGLNPGSSGYCTVARSETMRDAVVAQLEQWSIYTHGAGDKNPVICAYRILNLRGSVFHVLTRIVDSGLDYTGRTNFLAHHLVFQPHEIHGACSPAEVFFQWPGWEGQWQGGPRYLNDDGLSLHAIPRVTRMPAATWAEWAGDAGAAALLVTESGTAATARSADVVVPDGFEQGLLQLYAESLHLTDSKAENAPSVWAVPFTTFLQSQDDPTDFRWRGLVPANRGRAIAELLVDFNVGSIPAIPSNPLVEYARTGARRAAYLPGVNVSDFLSERSAKESSVSVPVIPKRVGKQSMAVPANRMIEGDVDVPPNFWGKPPPWIWISLLCAIPLGLLVGRCSSQWREGDTNPKRRDTPLENSQVAATSAIPQLPTPSPQAFALEPSLPSTATPTVQAPQPILEPPKVNDNDQQLQGIKHEIAALPEGPLIFSTRSTKEIDVPGESNNPLASLLGQCATTEEKRVGIKVELDYEQPFKKTLSSLVQDATYNTQEGKSRITTLDEPQCVFTTDKITISDKVAHDVVWVTIKSQRDLFVPIHMILANAPISLSKFAFDLPRSLLLIENSHILKLRTMAVELLNQRLNSWFGLDRQNTGGPPSMLLSLNATLASSSGSERPSSFNSSDPMLQIDFAQNTNEIQSKLKRATDDAEAATRDLQAEIDRQKAIISSQQKLQNAKMPDTIAAKLADDKFQLTQNESGATYYSLVRDWIHGIDTEEVDFPLFNTFPPHPPNGRYQYIKAVLQTLKASPGFQKANSDPAPRPQKKIQAQTLTPRQQMVELLNYLDGLISPSDAAFFDQDRIDQAQFKTSVDRLQKKLTDANQRKVELDNESKVKADLSTLKEVWINAYVDGKAVRLIDFPGDAAIDKTSDSFVPQQLNELAR